MLVLVLVPRLLADCGCFAVCRRAKAAWEAFYAAQLPELKEQKPGLKLMQYKSMIFDR